MPPRCEPRSLGVSNKLSRVVWHGVWLVLFRPSPVLAHGWRRFLLRLFGARIGRGAVIYPSARVWAPWDLRMEQESCLSHFVDCYCVAEIVLGKGAIVSQHAYLCTASHDYTKA